MALLAGVLWSQTGGPPPVPASLANALDGSLVYATAGEDGVTGRLWRVDLAAGSVTEGPRTVLPDEIVAGGGATAWIGVRGAGSAYGFPDFDPAATPELLARGLLVAWAPEGQAVFVVTLLPSSHGCPTMHIGLIDALSHDAQDVYDKPTCAVPDGLGVDGLTRPYVSLEGRASSEVFRKAGAGYGGVFEMGYRTLHRVVAGYALLGVSPVGDMLVGPRVQATTGVTDGSSPILRTLLAWKGVGGPTVMGTARHDLRAERFLAWSEDGHHAAILGTLGATRGVWLLDIEPGVGRSRPHLVGPALPPQVGSVGAAFAGDTVFATAEGRLYASNGRGSREIELPEGAPAPSGPILWLAH